MAEYQVILQVTMAVFGLPLPDHPELDVIFPQPGISQVNLLDALAPFWLLVY